MDDNGWDKEVQFPSKPLGYTRPDSGKVTATLNREKELRDYRLAEYHQGLRHLAQLLSEQD